ncbi:MAG: hypothetical protein ACREFR_16925, partial [Limisphaerales bacterium]
MNNEIAGTGPSPPASAIRWPAVVVTLLTGAVALGLLLAQLAWANNPESQLSLSNLDTRASELASITNLIERDAYCVPLSAFSRELDARLAPDARVFVTGMLGTTNFPKTGYYYSLKNYLFPRPVEISLDGKATSGMDAFYGVPCDSPDVLRSNGFDVMVDFTS